ncbi:hypothetical protein IGI04_027633, partial [Brassica rapa subsp. trilocularis]
RALKASQEEAIGGTNSKSNQEAGSVWKKLSPSAQNDQSPKERKYKSHSGFQFSAVNNGHEHQRRISRESRDYHPSRTHKPQPKAWQEKSHQRRSYYERDQRRQVAERSYRSSHDHSYHRNLPGPPSRSFYREIQKPILETKDTGSKAQTESPERLPASQRLGLIRPTQNESRAIEATDPNLNSQERTPVSLRLGPIPIPAPATQLELEREQRNPSSERRPASERLGPLLLPVDPETEDAARKIKRKPGRPPGKRKAQESLTQVPASGSRRRKVSQSKPSPVRRKGPSQRDADNK